MTHIKISNITDNPKDNSSLSNEPPTWQTLLAHAFKDVPSLCQYLQLDPQSPIFSSEAHKEFSLRVPLPYASRIEKGNYCDPLLLQVLPSFREMEYQHGYVTDPLEEASANPLNGLIHKYKNRVLLTLSGACAINCRYCFRRHFPYAENTVTTVQWKKILTYIQNDKNIEEVIFSGGDPLASTDSRLSAFVNDLSEIEHLQRLRIHTRLPVVIPQRITDAFCHILEATRLQTVLVIHANHANEFNDEVTQALIKLKHADVTVMNQAVLLKGVNDNVAAQKNLHTTSFKAGAIPYYLFVLDPVKGAAHFNISDSEAQTLMKKVQAELSGYLVPKLAREIPNKPNKTLLAI